MKDFIDVTKYNTESRINDLIGKFVLLEFFLVKD